VVADGAAQDRVPGFERIKRRAKRHGRGDVQLHFSLGDARQIT
jgi:hypothetical protein